jgi:hypothetical protein
LPRGAGEPCTHARAVRATLASSNSRLACNPANPTDPKLKTRLFCEYCYHSLSSISACHNFLKKLPLPASKPHFRCFFPRNLLLTHQWILFEDDRGKRLGAPKLPSSRFMYPDPPKKNLSIWVMAPLPPTLSF